MSVLFKQKLMIPKLKYYISVQLMPPGVTHQGTLVLVNQGNKPSPLKHKHTHNYLLHTIIKPSNMKHSDN